MLCPSIRGSGVFGEYAPSLDSKRHCRARTLAATQRNVRGMLPTLEAIHGVGEPRRRFGEIRRVDLFDVAEAHHLTAGTRAREQRLHLLRREVLRFVDDHVAAQKRTPTHEVERSDLDA